MGNEQSLPNISNSNNPSQEDYIKKLQEQVLNNQLEIQNLQLNNIKKQQQQLQQPQQNIASNPILKNQNLQKEILNNPSMRRQLLESLLKDNSKKLNSNQKQKIESLLQKNQSLSLEKINSNYEENEDQIAQEFERKQRIQREEFLQNQRKRQHEYQTKLNNLQKQNVNALKLFSLDNKYTIDELKRSYKKLAMKTHPDRNGGNKEKFQVVTKCYFLLLERLKKEEEEKPFYDLKSSSQSFRQTQSVDRDEPGQNFNIRKFNSIFEQHKLYNPDDDGYESWISDESNTPEKQPEIFSNKFNLDVFNNTFNNYKDQDINNQIVEFKEPQAMVSCDRMGYTEIDQKGKGNFTKNPETNSLGYSDLKKAYTQGNLINPNQVQVKEYQSIDQLENERGNISYDMSPEDIQMRELQRRQEEEEEERRLYRIQQRDSVISDNYSQVHQNMLGYKAKLDMRR